MWLKIKWTSLVLWFFVLGSDLRTVNECRRTCLTDKSISAVNYGGS